MRRMRWRSLQPLRIALRDLREYWSELQTGMRWRRLPIRLHDYRRMVVLREWLPGPVLGVQLS